MPRVVKPLVNFVQNFDNTARGLKVEDVKRLDVKDLMQIKMFIEMYGEKSGLMTQISPLEVGRGTAWPLY